MCYLCGVLLQVDDPAFLFGLDLPRLQSLRTLSKAPRVTVSTRGALLFISGKKEITAAL